MDIMLLLWQLALVIFLVLIPFSLYILGVSKRNTKEKMIWCFIILVFPIMGSLAYFLVGMRITQKN